MHARIVAFLERRPLLRWLIYAVLGLGIFMIGASYLRLQIRPDPVGFQVTGGDLLAKGWPATVRVRARSAHRGDPFALSVGGVALGGTALTFETEGNGPEPTTIRFKVPSDFASEAVSLPLQLTLSAGRTQEVVSVPISLTKADPESETQVSATGPLPETKRTLRVDLQPDAGEIVSNMDNRVYVRVRRPDGTPVAGAEVTLQHSTFPEGQHVLVTDAAGLGTIHLTPRLPNLDLRITATAPDADAVPEVFNTTIFTVGRQLAFEGFPTIVRPDQPTTVTVRTTRDGVDLFCDLRRGRQHIGGYRLPIPEGRTVAVEIPALDVPGRYDLQCYFNLVIPGSTFASRAFWVGTPDSIKPLADAAARSGLFGGKSLDVPAKVTAASFPDYAAYLASMLSERKVRSEVLVQTFETAVATADERWQDKKNMTLFALIGAIALILLVGLDLVIGNVLSNRRRFRAYEAGLAEDGALGDITLDGVDIGARHSTERLDRTRGWLFIVVVVGTLFANIIGFLMLSGMFRT